jgi:protein SCO1/2
VRPRDTLLPMLNLRRLTVTALAVLIVGSLTACGSSGGVTAPDAVTGHGLQGLILRPAKPAPPLVLRNYTGRRVSLASMRGKAVLVTFVYTHCPNVCPIIVSNLAEAQRELGLEARHLQIIAVTVDPRRDTPSAVKAFLAARGATGRMDYLIGSEAQLRPVWKAWDVGVTVDTKHVIAGHTSIIYGITASGRMAVVYPSNFAPAQIVHDTPLLARS